MPAVNAGYRTFLAVPLLREDKAIGVIVMRRLEVRPFTDKQIKLLETFADQAVIAIENVRLFKELQGTQCRGHGITGTADGDGGDPARISSSPTDIQPVLDAVTESAARLCSTDDVYIRRIEDNTTRIVAHLGTTPLPEEGYVRPLQLRTVVGAIARECRTIHIPDTTEAHVREKYPDSLTARHEARTLLYVPLLRDECGNWRDRGAAQ